MTLINRLLSLAFSSSIVLAPMASSAQDLDAWTLDRELLNAAANYTGVLTSAHGQVRKYITWQWNTSLSEVDQQTRTTAILSQIASTQQVTTALVPSLDSAVITGFDVRFRYCESTLLSYFEGTNFKHGLSAQQIVDAPVLRAQRADTTFHGQQLGRVGEGGLMLQTNGDSSEDIPACMGTAEHGGALPVGTVAYMTSAAQKFGVARTRKSREVQTLPCENGQVGAGIKQERFQSTDYNAQGDPLHNNQGHIPYDPQDENFDYSYYDDATLGGDGHWRIKVSQCRAPATISIHEVRACTDDPSRTATYQVFLTEADNAIGETPPIVWRPSDADGTLDDTAVGVLVPHLSFCEGAAPDSFTLDPEISSRTETRAGVCPASHPLGTMTKTREVEIRTWQFADSPVVQGIPALSDVVTEIAGEWVTDDSCYRNVDDRSEEFGILRCSKKNWRQSGWIHREQEKTVTGVDWHSPERVDQLITSYSEWVETANGCYTRPTQMKCNQRTGAYCNDGPGGWDGGNDRSDPDGADCEGDDGPGGSGSGSADQCEAPDNGW